MTEPTGEPLLDRLDARVERMMEHRTGILDEHEVLAHAKFHVHGENADELRAALLQYRGDREECEAARHQYRKSLVGIIHERDQLQRQRDALVEALKKARGKVAQASITSSLGDGLRLREEAVQIMDAALPEEGASDG